MTLNDLYPRFQGHNILWRWISQKRYEIQTQFQWNTNKDLHMPYSTVSFRMTLVILSDLAKNSMTRSIARPRCGSWASCQLTFKWCHTGDLSQRRWQLFQSADKTYSIIISTMRPSSRDRIMQFTTCVRPSVCPMPTVNSKTENCTTFKVRGDIVHVRSNWQSIILGQLKGHGRWGVKFKNRFAKKYIDSCKTKIMTTFRPIMHVWSNTVQQRKCVLFEITGRRPSTVPMCCFR